MKNYTKQLTIATAVAALAVSASVSQGAVTIAQSLTGQNLIQTAPLPGGAIDGTVSSWVLSGYNPAGLTFVFQVMNALSAPDAISIATFTTFPSAVIVSTGTAANSSFFGGPAFGVAGTQNFVYTGDTPGGAATFTTPTSQFLGQGAASYLLYIQTDVTTVGAGTGLEQDNFQALGNTLAPIPEPTTIAAGALMLLPLGIGAMRSLRKDRTV